MLAWSVPAYSTQAHTQVRLAVKLLTIMPALVTDCRVHSQTLPFGETGLRPWRLIITTQIVQQDRLGFECMHVLVHVAVLGILCSTKPPGWSTVLTSAPVLLSCNAFDTCKLGIVHWMLEVYLLLLFSAFVSVDNIVIHCPPSYSLSAVISVLLCVTLFIVLLLLVQHF